MVEAARSASAELGPSFDKVAARWTCLTFSGCHEDLGCITGTGCLWCRGRSG